MNYKIGSPNIAETSTLPICETWTLPVGETSTFQSRASDKLKQAAKLLEQVAEELKEFKRMEDEE